MKSESGIIACFNFVYNTRVGCIDVVRFTKKSSATNNSQSRSLCRVMFEYSVVVGQNMAIITQEIAHQVYLIELTNMGAKNTKIDEKMKQHRFLYSIYKVIQFAVQSSPFMVNPAFGEQITLNEPSLNSEKRESIQNAYCNEEINQLFAVTEAKEVYNPSEVESLPIR